MAQLQGLHHDLPTGVRHRQRARKILNADGQGDAVLDDAQFVHGKAVDRDQHWQGRYFHGLTRRIVFAGCQFQSQQTGRQVINVRPPVQQVPPICVQMKVFDVHRRPGKCHGKRIDMHAEPQGAGRALDLAVELRGGSVERPPRPRRRCHQPDKQAANKQNRQNDRRSQPQQNSTQPSRHAAQNAIPREKCRRARRSRWP